jgi:non-ribosomal peptide synthetase component F
MTLLAAFQAVLSRATGKRDVTVTSLFANRAQPGAARLIGNFFSFLPLRVQIDGGAGFRGLLEQVRDATLAAYENADVLYEEVLEEAAGATQGDPVSDFRVSFALQSLPAARLADGCGLAISRLSLDTGLISQDLTFLLSPAGDRLSGRLRYDSGVLDPVLAARLRDGFLQILSHAALDPDRPLDELPAGGFPASRGRRRGSA